LTHRALTVPRYQILRVLNRLFLYSCSKPEHPPVGDHSCTTGNRSRNLCYESWSLSHLGYLYPRTTPVMIKLDHNRSCPWVQIAQAAKAPTIKYLNCNFCTLTVTNCWQECRILALYNCQVFVPLSLRWVATCNFQQTIPQLFWAIVQLARCKFLERIKTPIWSLQS